MIDQPLLAAMAAVVREGSFDRAARALHITPSAVSQRVRLIEERLGAVLIVRGQPCTPTEIGERLCRHAELVGLLEAELRRDLPGASSRGLQSPPARLRIAVNADSLCTWFVAAMAEFARADSALLEVLIDDQDHTAEGLRRGQVLGAVTSLAAPVAGCRSRRLGSLRYLATASPAFVRQWFAAGVNGETLRAAPSLRFDRKDSLQNTWAQRVTRRALQLPAHELPSTQAFVDATLSGIGWAMHPQSLVQEHVASGRLRVLLAERPLDVPLYWQCARLPVPSLERLTQALTAVARVSLRH